MDCLFWSGIRQVSDAHHLQTHKVRSSRCNACLELVVYSTIESGSVFMHKQGNFANQYLCLYLEISANLMSSDMFGAMGFISKKNLSFVCIIN